MAKVRVGGANAVDPITQLPMYREHTTFEGNYKQRFIKVFYDQWLESNGVAIELKSGKSYFVIDQAAVSHIVPGDPDAIPPTEDITVQDSPAYPMFSGWQNKPIKQEWVGARLGEDIIIGAINGTLIAMAFDVPDGYKVIPVS